jgi:hypothetical protein
VVVTHNEVIARLQAIAPTVDVTAAANVFVAACGSADTKWRSVLPALSVALAMPSHDLDDWSRGMCRVCFLCENNTIYPTKLAFANHRYGGVLDGNPIEALVALEIASREPTWPEPTSRDVWVFHQMLDLLRGLAPTARYGKARSAILSTKLLAQGNTAQCTSWLEQLGLIGVLETAERSGMFTAFTNALTRDQRPNVRVEPSAPLGWWTAADGLNETLIDRLFGHLPCPENEPTTAKKATLTTDNVARRLPKVVQPPTARQVYAVKVGSSYAAVYCHAVETSEKGIVRARIEFLDVLLERLPTQLEVAGRTTRDRSDGRWQGWCTGLANTSGVRLIAEDMDPPVTSACVPDRVPFCRAAELRHLAKWHFAT